MTVLRKASWLLGVGVVLCLTGSALAQELTLEDALARFMENSPVVGAEREKVAAVKGRAKQSRLRPNPVLIFSQEGYPLGRNDAGFDHQEFLVGASQEFELGGRRGKERERGDLEIEAEAARFEEFIRVNKLEVSRVFVTAYHASERKRLIERALSRYQDLLTLHRRQYELGEVSGLAQAKFEAEELWYQVALARAQREFNANWKDLAAWITWDSPEVPRLVMRNSADITPPAVAELTRQALSSRPDLKVLRLEAAVAAKAVEVERSRNVPSLDLSAGYKRDFGQNSFFVGVELPLPLWDRRQGAVEAKQAESRRMDTLSRWKEVWIGYEINRAYQSLENLREVSQRLGPGLTKELDRIVEVTFTSYRAGEAGILECLDAVRTRRDAVLEQDRLLEELDLARLELEHAVGKRID